MKLNKILLIPTIAILAFFLSSTQSQAKSYQIGNEQVPASKLYKFKYYQAIRSTKVRVQFEDGGHQFIKIPKGTILQGFKDNHTITLSLPLLNYSLYNKNRPHNRPYDFSSSQISNHPQNFKRISRPAYMPAYSSGLLFQGKMLANAQRRDTTLFHISTNGYVEYRKYSSESQYKPKDKPTHQIKIQRTKAYGNTRELFLNKKFKGLSFKKVKQHGKVQYRLDVINLHQPFMTEGQSDDDVPSMYYSNYLVGGRKMYTEIANSELM